MTLVVLSLLAFALYRFSDFFTEYLWFDQLGYRDVLLTRWGTSAALFVVGALVFGAALYASISLAYRYRPIYPPLTREDILLAQFRANVEPMRKTVTVVLPLAVAVIAGIGLAGTWQQVQLLINQTPFGSTDPVFGRDIAFYVFTLPVLEIITLSLRTLCLLAFIANGISHFFNGAISYRNTKLTFTKAARVQLGILATVFVLLQAASYWLDRYALLNKRHQRFAGADYTDINAFLPAYTILAFGALVVAVLFVAWIVKDDIRLPVTGIGIMVVSALAAGAAYPYLVQNFQVKPNERNYEKPYIARNIEATRAAYGLDKVEVKPYAAQTDAKPGALRSDAQTTASLRLLDPNVVSPTFDQREANRRYWGFEQTLSVDRYRFDGQVHDTVIGVRELRPDRLQLDKDSWLNRHIIYTHGFGVAAAYGNKRNPDGEPAFFESGVPSNGKLGEYEERIYFGKRSTSYSIVGAPKGAAPQEFDYQSSTGDNAKQVNNTYSGNGGPSLGNLFNRVAYAIKMRDINILISSYVNESSQILYNRDPQKRVKEVAPYLSIDSGAYPSVVNGRIVWIVDAYTTSDKYPYSQPSNLEGVLSESRDSVLRSREGGDINYIRNSVKATVDAYDGSVKLYAWDTKDPILASWQKVFPGALKPVSEIDGELMSHLRYPEDMFRVQRAMLGAYHVTDPEEFFVGQDFWQTPADPIKNKKKNAAAGAGLALQSPYYLTMQVPGQESPRFSLSSSYIPRDGQGVLSGFLVADSETGADKGKVADSYGKLTLLQLPSGNTVNGPGQVQNTFDADPEVGKVLNLLRQGDTTVIQGNLLTVPVGGGLLYVQPVYVQSNGSGSYPLLQMVLASFGDKIGFATTLDGALDQVFGGDSGANLGDEVVGGEAKTVVDIEGGSTVAGTDNAKPGAKPEEGAAKPAPSPAPGTAQERLDASLKQMQEAMAEADKARQAGDWAAYGNAEKKLRDALDRALAAKKEIGG
ncbi:UPF0182 family membrane protein [Dermabacteraceae bacterium P7054]